MSDSTPFKNIAIIGAAGHVGSHFAAALLKTGKHTVTAITRSDSTSTLPAGMEVKKVDYDNEDELVSALRGQEFLVITLSTRAPQDLHKRIVVAAQKAGVAYVMPNAYGGDVTKPGFSDELWSAATSGKIVEIQELGAPYIMMMCGFWYEWSLAGGSAAYGIDIPARTVTFFDNGLKKINTSTWKLCGEALAALLSLPKSGASPAVSDWKNSKFPIGSFEISQRDMVDSLHRVLGTTDEDWKIAYEPSEKRVRDGKEELMKGDPKGFAKALYSRMFYPEIETWDPVNAVLGLEQESLDEATKRTVEMIAGGFDPFKH